MSKKNGRPAFVPVEAIFLQEGFVRNYELLMSQENSEPAIKAMVTQALVEKAKVGMKYSKTQAEKASAPRKLDAGQEKRIAKIYWDKVASGEKYGAVKALAVTFKVSATTINTIAKRHRPNSIGK